MSIDTSASDQRGVHAGGRDFYHDALSRLQAARAPFLVGGAFALDRYTGISRYTKDFDIFVLEDHFDAILALLEEAGYRTECTFSHWLGKAWHDDHFLDIIFNSGNGIVPVDDTWFRRAPAAQVFGLEVQLVPPEELIWSKSFIQERERFDGADVEHVLHAQAERIDWEHLLARFGDRWRVLFAHLVLFGFIYPGERERIPAAVMEELSARLAAELRAPAPTGKLCQGTILSREQYLIDVRQWGYRDARRPPTGNMSRKQIGVWTDAIDWEKSGTVPAAPPDDDAA